MALVTITVSTGQEVRILASAVVAIQDVSTDTSTAQCRVIFGSSSITLPMTAAAAATALGL